VLESSADRAASVDCGALYEELRQELIALVRALDAEDLDRRVPATPGWRIRDALTHVTGITADLNRLDFGGLDPDAWTARQVERHRTSPIEQIITEWDAEAPTFEEGLRLLGYETGSHFVGDLHAHLQDVRATLGLAPQDAETTVRVALDFYLHSLDEALRTDAAGTLTVVAGGERHVAGDGQPEATLTADAFEVLRALSGRRSLRQVLALEWTGAADALAPTVSRYPLPRTDLRDQPTQNTNDSGGR
jgi:uncharacterized protein (TIGR03083 family)